MKDYKKHPFKVGDIVYSPFFGRGKVNQISEYSDEYAEDAVKIWVHHDDNGRIIDYTNEIVWILSFTPYEINSNWERIYCENFFMSKI